MDTQNPILHSTMPHSRCRRALGVILLAFVLLTAANMLGAQQNIFLSPTVQPVQGGHTQQGNFGLSYTIGEPLQTTLQNGNLMLTQGFEQPSFSVHVTLSVSNLSTSLVVCRKDTLIMSVSNTSNDTLSFSALLTFGNAARAQTFHIVAPPTLQNQDTIIGDSVFIFIENLAPNPFNPFNIVYTVETPCSNIPSSGSQLPTVTNLIGVRSDTLGLPFFGLYSINGDSTDFTSTDTIFYPLLNNITSSVSLNLAVAQTDTITFNFTNSGFADFNGYVALSTNLPCLDSTLEILELIARVDTTITTIPNPSLTDSFALYVPQGETFSIQLVAHLNDCLPSNICNGNIRLRWGCSGSLCKINNNIPVSISQPTGRPYVIVSRISPVAGAGGDQFAWDAACMNSETNWEFLIINRGSAVAQNVTANLFNQFATHTFVIQGTVHIDTNDVRFPNTVIPVIDTVVVNMLDSNELGTDNPVDCYNYWKDSSGMQPIQSYFFSIPELQPNQSVVLRFKTWRCCAADNKFNTGVTYNHWQLYTGYTFCGIEHYGNELPTSDSSYWLHDTYYTSFDTTSTYMALYSTGYISSHAFVTQTPDLELQQTYTASITDIAGGRHACGDPEKISITNDWFPNTEPADFDAQLFCNESVSGIGNANVTGLNPRGIFKMDFNCQTGLKMNPDTVPTITNNGVIWHPASYNVVGNNGVAFFDLANLTGYNDNAYHFRNDFFLESDINFWLQACCPAPANSFCVVNTSFNPDVYGQSCDTCFIPLASDTVSLQLRCPGCITPGIIISDYKLHRTNFGCKDINDNGRPDGSSLVRISNGYLPLDSGLMYLHRSIVGDTLQGVADAYLIDGDPVSGFTYAQWQAYWYDSLTGSPAFKHIYFEEQISNTGIVGLKCISAKLEYLPVDSSNSVTYFLANINGNNPLIPDSNGRLILHFHVDSLPVTGGAKIKPQDRFRVIMQFTVCNNPTAITLLLCKNQLYLSVPVLTQTYPYSSGTATISDWYEQQDSTYQADIDSNSHAGAWGYNPLQEVLFVCETFNGAHYVYPIKKSYNETWLNPSTGCGKSVQIEGSYYIGGRNVFPYEYRPMPGIFAEQNYLGPMLADSLPVLFHFSLPHGYKAYPSFSYTKHYSYDNIIQNAEIKPIVPTNAIDTNATLIGGFSRNYRVNTDSVYYIPPFENITSFNNNPGSPNYPYLFINYAGKRALFLGDEIFTQGMNFTITAICDSATQVLDTILPNDEYMLIPEYAYGCSDSISNQTLNNTQINYLSIPQITIHAATLNPVFSSNHIDVPVKFSTGGGSTTNLVLYALINIDSLPSGVNISCLSTGSGCTGNLYPDTILSNGTDTFVLYTIDTITPMADTLYLRVSLDNCDSIGRTIHMPFYYYWSCDHVPHILPADTTLCSAPQKLNVDVQLPAVNLNLQNATIGTPRNTCTGITYSVQLKNAAAGGVGELIASVILPQHIQTASGSVKVGTGGVAHTVSVTHSAINGSDTLWVIHADTLTAFSSGSLVHANGFEFTDGSGILVFTFTLRTDCHADSIPSFNMIFDGLLYCGRTFAQADADNIGFDSVVYTFSPIAITGNGCGPYITANVTGAPCYGPIAYTTSLGCCAVNPLDTTWLPFTPNFSAPDTGIYFVTVTDSNGCKDKDTVRVNPPFTPVVKLLDTPCDTIPNVTMIVDSLHLGSYSYLWSNGSVADTAIVQPDYSVTYQVSVTDINGCTKTADKIISHLSVSYIVHCNGIDTVMFYTYHNGQINFNEYTGGTPPFSFLWYRSDTSVHYSIPIYATGDPYIFTAQVPDSLLYQNTYLLTTDANGCVAITLRGSNTINGCCFSHIVSVTDTLLSYINENALSSMLNIYSGAFVSVADSVTLTIDDTLTLQNCEVVLGANAKIEIRNNSQLNLKGSYIHGCREMWQGIYLQPGALLIADSFAMNRSKIADAVIAVKSINGAVVNLKNTDFINNRISVLIDSGGQYSGTVESCNFFYQSPGLLVPYSGKHPSSGVTVTNTEHWHIPEYGHPANTFTGLNNGINVRMSGLLNATPNHGFYVYSNRFTDIQNYEPCASLLCQWAGGAVHHGNAVYLSCDPQPVLVPYGTQPTGSPVLPANYWLNWVEGDTFNNCYTGIKAVAANLAIRYNKMNNLTYGIDVSKCWHSEAAVYNNVIDTVNYGITLRSNTAGRIRAYNNNITVCNLIPQFTYQITNLANGTPVSILSSGVTEDYYGIKLQESTAPSWWVKIYNNTVQRGRNSIVLQNPQQGCEVFGNTINQNGTQQVMGIQNGIYVNAGQKFRIYDNTITGTGNGVGDVNPFQTNNAALSANRKQGMFISHGLTYDIFCNTLTTLQRGLTFRQNCMANDSAVHENIFDIYQRGLMLEAAGGVPGWIGGRIGGLYHVSSNQWDVASSVTNRWETYNFTYTTSSFPQTLLYWLTIPDTSFKNGSNISNQQVLNVPADGSATVADDCIPVAFMHQGNFSSREYALVADTLVFEEYDTIAKWQSQKDLYAKIAALYAVDSLTDTAMYIFYHSSYEESFARSFQFDSALQTLSDSTLAGDTAAVYSIFHTAEEANKFLSGSPVHLALLKNANQLLLKYLRYGETSFDSTNIVFIQQTAFSCPYQYGEGVYTARYLYEQLSDTVYYFDDLLYCYEGGSGKRDDNEETETSPPKPTQKIATASKFRIIPNPAKNEARVIYELNKDENALFSLYDITGKKLIADITLTEKGIALLNLQGLSNGIYSYRAVGNKGSIFSGKLVITH